LSSINDRTDILFVSSYLSKYKGSLCVSEKLAVNLNDLGYNAQLVSRFRNRLIRIIDIIFKIFISNAKCIHIDVYSGQAFIITEVASLLGKMLGKKIIFTLHGGALQDFYPNHRKRIHRAFNRADLITTPSKMLLLFFNDKGFDIRYICNSVELEHFPFNRSSVRPFTLLWVRAFDPIYNPQLAIQTLIKLREKYPETTLTMVGPDKGSLQEALGLIREQKLEPYIQITGPVSNRELYKYYQSHEVFLNTTSYESFGVAVLEAAACGIPVVSTAVGELPLLWEHGKEILLVEKADGSNMADAVQQILCSPELAETLAHNARKKAETFDWEKIKPVWINLLNHVHGK